MDDVSDVDVMICLNMIVKNESRIIERCLDSLADIVDCGCILDTGSTDDTVEIIESWFKAHNKPLSMHKSQFKNFRDSRNEALELAEVYMSQEYAKKRRIVLLSDADFVWRVSGQFVKTSLSRPSYSVTQVTDIENNNVRLIDLDYRWRYHLVTHEYVACDNLPAHLNSHVLLDTLKIDDIHDGGCKHDKYERDIRLIKAELQDNKIPLQHRVRYQFYLAQSYFCSNQPIEALIAYKLRLGYKGRGYYQECYICCLRITQIYLRLFDWLMNNPDYRKINEDDNAMMVNNIRALSMNEYGEYEKNTKSPIFQFDTDHEIRCMTLSCAVYWVNQSMSVDHQRVEALYELVKTCRIHSLHDLSFRYCRIANSIIETQQRKLPANKLWLTPAYYQYMLDYELIIIAYYINLAKQDQYTDRSIVYKAIIRSLTNDKIPNDILTQIRANSKYYM